MDARNVIIFSLYYRVLELWATASGPFRAYQIRKLVLQQAIKVLDSDILGLHITLARAVPPRFSLHKVRSLVEIMEVHTPPYIGSYRLIRLLGRGGMGEVYEAQERDTHQQQAINQYTQRWPVPPSKRHPALSSLDVVLLQALARSEDWRSPSVADFAEAFLCQVLKEEERQSWLDLVEEHDGLYVPL